MSRGHSNAHLREMWTRIAIFVLSAITRPRRNVTLGVAILLVILGGAACFGEDDSTSAPAKSNGRVTIVY
jgi:hypothetical protein